MFVVAAAVVVAAAAVVIAVVVFVAAAVIVDVAVVIAVVVLLLVRKTLPTRTSGEVSFNEKVAGSNTVRDAYVAGPSMSTTSKFAVASTSIELKSPSVAIILLALIFPLAVM